MMKQIRRALLVGVLAVTGAACSDDGASDAAETTAKADNGADASGAVEGGAVKGPVLVFAAASLTDAFGDVKTAFEKNNPDAEVQLTRRSSSPTNCRSPCRPVTRAR